MCPHDDALLLIATSLPPQHVAASASVSVASHSGSLRGEIGWRSAASTWPASASLISSASRDTRGEPRSAVISLSGDVSCSGGGGAFLRGETFFASALTGEESVLSRDFFFGFLGVADLPTVGGVATGGPGFSVGVTLDGATAAVVSEALSKPVWSARPRAFHGS